MPSALYSSNYSATANNILNKFDNSPIYDSATGAWTFKDNAGNSLISATTSAISLNKATTVTGNFTATRDGANLSSIHRSFGTGFYPVFLTSHGRGTLAAPTQVKSGDYVCEWQAYAYDAISTQRLQFSIGVIASSDITTNGQSAIEFKVGGTKAIDISSAGVVTLGSSSSALTSPHNAYSDGNDAYGGGADFKRVFIFRERTNNKGVSIGYNASGNGAIGAMTTGPATGLDLYTYSGTAGVLAVQISSAGAVRVGPTSGYTSLRHSIYCEETATAGSINKYIIVNVNGGTYKMAVYNA